MANIGFIGLGHMGFPMATNLIKHGHKVTGYDLQPSVLENFSQAKGHVAKEVIEAVKDQEVVITMLQTGQQVAQLCLDKNSILHQAKPGSLFMDCSTIDVDTTRKVHQMATSLDLLVVDAPVSGGVAGASAGSLTFMVGGEIDAFQACEPILTCMGQKIIHAGAAGSGQAAKICNNMVLGVSMVALSEAFILAEQLGLSAQKLFEVINNSSGQSWASTRYVPVPGILDNVPANQGYKPGFAAMMMLKDLHLSQDAAEMVGITTPLGAKATTLYQQFIDEGFGDLDFSGIIRLIEQIKL